MQNFFHYLNNEFGDICLLLLKLLPEYQRLILKKGIDNLDTMLEKETGYLLVGNGMFSARYEGFFKILFSSVLLDSARL